MQLGQGPLEVLHGATEQGELLVVGGELVEYGGDRVGRHAQLQGNEVPSSGAHSGGTWSGILRILVAGPASRHIGADRRQEDLVAPDSPVGGVLPGARQAGDDRCVATADHEHVPGQELADHVRRGHVVAGAVVLAADPPGGLAAQLAGRLERGGVGDAGQVHLHRAGVEDDLAAVLSPAFDKLGLAVRHRDDLDALAAGVCQPERQRHRADLGYLVQAHQQRRIQPPAR